MVTCDFDLAVNAAATVQYTCAIIIICKPPHMNSTITRDGLDCHGIMACTVQ